MVRKKIKGTAERPRLSVYRSLKHIYAQIVDDEAGKTLLMVSTLDKKLRETLKVTSNVEAAKKVGEELARRAFEKGIKKVVFDRGDRPYHGRIKAVAEGARSAGLII